MLYCIFMWKRQLSYFLLWFLNHKLREDEEICHNSCESKAIHKTSLTHYSTLAISKDVQPEDVWDFCYGDIRYSPKWTPYKTLILVMGIRSFTCEEEMEEVKLPQLSAVWRLSSSTSDFYKPSTSCSADICMSRTFCHHPTESENSHRLK